MKKYVIYIGLLGLVLLVLLLLLVPAFAVLGETLLYIAILLSAFWIFDEKVMKEIDTIEELKKGNIAYAIFLLAIALLFLAVATIVG